ncbi:DUF3619 family protein [Paracidovorax citrulli]|uniref:Transmembrane protein n=2 Tax=Paracidovorax citrulli TaxID=80869 RepID=A1TRU0_PARC0|nr:DUF3619 family protein [Paracidovorax citrulli]ABM33678.1 putative transmembrane protein [Paracidovorax citrulli AAC00-1]ATG94278.1 DUF3619 domain-containing protein [Paracidovorax citrulli]PVY63110.1 uncharacterized protein DUF3619 [Paracidovorax citrulli]QCX12590.1 hypothetical protein APS58_3876 [Paracidovorax citrulli]REG67907.1 uncharacterized protein DUF3619 [Paracidovorax citrulli]
MNSTSQSLSVQEAGAERFARRVTARLSEGTADMPYDISERLRAARVQAVSRRKRVASVPVRQAAGAAAVFGNKASAILGGGGEGRTWWRALASVIPLTALAVGLVVINVAQEEKGMNEVAEVDAALLTDDLPPSAYADPGFLQYLKTTAQAPNR